MTKPLLFAGLACALLLCGASTSFAMSAAGGAGAGAGASGAGGGTGGSGGSGGPAAVYNPGGNFIAPPKRAHVQTSRTCGLLADQQGVNSFDRGAFMRQCERGGEM